MQDDFPVFRRLCGYYRIKIDVAVRAAVSKRKFYNVLLDWKEKRADKYAVLIDGARRVGKSWIAEEFGKREYEKYVLIDFSKASPALKRIFAICRIVSARQRRSPLARSEVLLL